MAIIVVSSIDTILRSREKRAGFGMNFKITIIVAMNVVKVVWHQITSFLHLVYQVEQEGARNKRIEKGGSMTTADYFWTSSLLIAISYISYNIICDIRMDKRRARHFEYLLKCQGKSLQEQERLRKEFLEKNIKWFRRKKNR